MDRKLINGLCFRCWSCKAWSWLSDSLYSVGHSTGPMFIPNFTPLPHHIATIFYGSWESCVEFLYSWVICSSQPWLIRQVGLDNLKRSLTTPGILCVCVWWTGSRNWTCFKILNKNRTASFIPTGFIKQQQTRKKRSERYREEEKRDCLSQDLCFKKHSSVCALWSLLNLNWWGR